MACEYSWGEPTGTRCGRSDQIAHAYLCMKGYLFPSHSLKLKLKLKVSIRPRNANTVDGTHIMFNLRANHTQTKDATNMRPLLSGLCAT